MPETLLVFVKSETGEILYRQRCQEVISEEGLHYISGNWYHVKHVVRMWTAKGGSTLLRDACAFISGKWKLNGLSEETLDIRASFSFLPELEHIAIVSLGSNPYMGGF